MSQCPFQSRLSAFHDHELDAHTAGQLDAHLPGCTACNETLSGIRAVSRLMNGVETGRMSQMGVARLHAAADHAGRRRDVFPFTKMMIAVAASVLVIAGAWLVEIPSHIGVTSSIANHVRPEADWEKLASGGKLQLKGIANDTDVAVAKWMLQSLKKESGS